MAQYRLPRHVEFRDSLPENIAGKVLRRFLVEEELAAAEAAGDR
jgi:long-chain acyl-CoA synthetase